MFILASQSPRRQQLMKRIVSNFIIETSSINESESLHLPPLLAVKEIAYRKGEDISKKHPNDIVISADTIVVLNNQIIGKPKDKADAYRILKKLSNQMHTVITAYCIFYHDKSIGRTVHSQVIMNLLDDDLITKYIESGIPMDKAGGYAVQDNKKYPVVKTVIGSVDNVIGFPVEEINNDLKRTNLL